VQQYQNDNWRRVRVMNICADIIRLLRYEIDPIGPSSNRHKTDSYRHTRFRKL
jgi:hypothetical protein